MNRPFVSSRPKGSPAYDFEFVHPIQREANLRSQSHGVRGRVVHHRSQTNQAVVTRAANPIGPRVDQAVVLQVLGPRHIKRHVEGHDQHGGLSTGSEPLGGTTIGKALGMTSVWTTTPRLSAGFVSG